MKRVAPGLPGRLTGLALGLCAVTGGAWAGPLFDAGVSYSYDDNLSNGQLSSDAKGDQFIDLNLSGGRYTQLTSSLGLILTGKLKLTAYDTYSDLNSTTLGVEAVLRKKFGLGPMAPMLKARAEISHRDSHHNPRDGWIYKAGLGVGKRLTERLNFALDYEHLETEPDEPAEDIPFLATRGVDGDVFDIRRDSLTASLIFAVTERLSAYGSYSRQQGDIVASTVPVMEFLINGVYEKGAIDTAFGPGPGTLPIVAYRIDADTDIFSFGLSWALDSHASFNLGYERRESDGGLNFQYDNNITSASLLYAF